MAPEMIAVDTNLLVYAHRVKAPFHAAAKRCVLELAEGRTTWAIPWSCLHEFVCVVTHPRIYRPPTPLDEALGQVEAWLASPSVVVLGEPAGYWSALSSAARVARSVGPLVYDARIATICQLHGVRELWTADRDFTRFPDINVFNPLVADSVHETAPAYGARRRARTAVRRRTLRRRTLAAHAE
jgi:toxin-antitoxin system PIN domain toxin